MEHTRNPRRFRRFRRLGTASVAAIALTAGLFAGTAHATFPGANGKIYYIQGGNVFSVNPDGTGATQLTTDGQDTGPVADPTGATVAFLRFDLTTDLDQVYTMNADGTGQTQITNGVSVESGILAWSPNGTQLVYQPFGSP